MREGGGGGGCHNYGEIGDGESFFTVTSPARHSVSVVGHNLPLMTFAQEKTLRDSRQRLVYTLQNS